MCIKHLAFCPYNFKTFFFHTSTYIFTIIGIDTNQYILISIVKTLIKRYKTNKIFFFWPINKQNIVVLKWTICFWPLTKRNNHCWAQRKTSTIRR